MWRVRFGIVAYKHTPIPSVDTVTIQIDQERRMLHSKYHTAGHLIAAVVEKENSELKAIKGHQFPREAYVELDGVVSEPEHFMAHICARVSERIARRSRVRTEELSVDDAAILAQNYPYELPKNKSLRVCQIEGFSPVPCGGTHVNTLDEISCLIIRKCKSKKD